MSVEEVPSPSCGPAQVRVGVHFAGVSFVDVLTATGGYQVRPPTPFIPGSEFSGVVLEVGAEVAGVARGARVAGGAFGGAMAEELVISAAGLTVVPAGVDLAQAAVIRANFMTAVYALARRAELKSSETVLVLGAGGAVGIAAIQVGKALGARLIGSASSEDKRALALACGASAVVDSNAPDWRDQIKALTDGRGVDIVVDPLGGEHTERAFRALAWNGRHLVIGFAAGQIPKLPANLALLKGAALLGVDLRQFEAKQPGAFCEVAAEVARLTAAGKARPPIARVYPIENYVEAMRLAKSGAAAGRILLKMPAAA
jgi:NADPH2:quinone reductase